MTWEHSELHRRRENTKQTPRLVVVNDCFCSFLAQVMGLSESSWASSLLFDLSETDYGGEHHTYGTNMRSLRNLVSSTTWDIWLRLLCADHTLAALTSPNLTATSTTTPFQNAVSAVTRRDDLEDTCPKDTGKHMSHTPQALLTDHIDVPPPAKLELLHLDLAMLRCRLLHHRLPLRRPALRPVLPQRQAALRLGLRRGGVLRQGRVRGQGTVLRRRDMLQGGRGLRLREDVCQEQELGGGERRRPWWVRLAGWCCSSSSRSHGRGLGSSVGAGGRGIIWDCYEMNRC